MTQTTSPFDPRQLRDVLGRFVTGVTIITTRDAEGEPHGVTANSFTSVSINPPLVLWCQALKAQSYPIFNDSETFAVNILAEHQAEMSSRFARSGEDKFLDLDHDRGLGEVPILPEVIAHLECRKVASHLAGDHVIYIGEITKFARTDGKPLVFSGGKYTQISQ